MLYTAAAAAAAAAGGGGVVAVALEPAEQGDMVPIPIALAIPSLDLSLVSPTEATGT